MILSSDIAAKVWKVLCAQGDIVGKGDELVILESMKMEIPVVAPMRGTVAAVFVASGDLVQAGGRLIEIT
ncbi:MAG: biotin/lipoyl-binding carrier protein [Acidimicrobiia bacterium]